MCRWRSQLNYLAGLVAGDGTLYYYKKTNEYFTYIYDSNKEFLQLIGKETAKIFKVSYTIVKPSKEKNYYRLQFTSKKIYELVKHLLDVRPKKPTKSFIRGLIDAEGSLYMDKRGRLVLQIGLTNYTLANSIYMWIIKRGLRATLTKYRDKRINRKTIFKVYVRGWENVQRLINEVRPNHPKISQKFHELYNLRFDRGTPP